jgi:protoporphyrinogen oxidase
MQQTHTLILGAGLAGLSAACHLAGHEYLVIEKEGTAGGLCTSEEKQGFVFDQTGHWLHMRDRKVHQFIASLPGIDWDTIIRRAHVFSNNTITCYPFQSHTFGLPPQVIRDCVQGFIRAHRDGDRSRVPENFYEWCLANLGEGISRHFMVPYNSKLYTVHPQELACHWCETYIPVPTIEQVVEGSLTNPGHDSAGYNATFSYPCIGGIGSLPEALFRLCPKERFLFNARPVAIDMQRRVARLASGDEIGFSALISTIPLRDFLRLVYCRETDRLQAAAGRMKIASVSYCNAAFKRPPAHPGHWFYIPEERFMPYRVGFYSNVQASMAPQGCSSAYIEYTHQGAPVDEGAFRRASVELVQAMGLFKSEADVLFMDCRLIENGYVIFHREYPEDMQMIEAWCRASGVALAGRYGRWVYSAMEDALLDGMRAAGTVRERCAAGQ